MDDKKEQDATDVQKKTKETPVEKRKTKRAGKITATVLLLFAGAVLGSGAVLYRKVVLPRGLSWLYPWMEPAVIAGVLLAAGLLLVLWLPVGKKAKGLLAGCGFLTAVLAVVCVTLLLPETVSVRKSPDEKNTLVIVEDREKHTLAVSRVYYGFWKREKDMLPFQRLESLKYQWLQNDVCAVTGTDGDGVLHQYLATYGERGDGISYMDPLAAMSGSWEAEVDGEKWRLRIGGTVELETPEGLQSFDSGDCGRYGTIAVTLGKGTGVRWSLVMNQDCRLNDGRIAQGGTLTLCAADTGETKPVVFASTDEREAWNESERAAEGGEENKIWVKLKQYLSGNSREKQNPEETIVEKMHFLAESNPSGEGYAPKQDGIFFVAAADTEECWNVRNILKEFAKTYRVNGYDCAVQIDSIQCLAGDQEEGRYEVHTTEFIAAPGIAGQVAEGSRVEMKYTFRMVKTALGYYVYRTFETGGSGGLEADPGELYVLSDNSGYSYFLRGEYDTADRYGFAKAPEEGMRELYKEMLEERYPAAVETTYEESPAMRLDGKASLYLLYDGITEDCLHYRYRMVQSQTPQLQPDSRLQTKEVYQTVIKRGMTGIAAVGETAENARTAEHAQTAEHPSNSGGDTSDPGKRRSGPREGEVRWDSYNGDYAREMVLKEQGITFRMVVLDAALGSRFYGLAKSYDGGETWYKVGTDPFNSRTGMDIDFTFLDEDFGFAALAHNGGDSAQLYVTEDGGFSYSPVDMEEKLVTLEGGGTFAPYDYPRMPYWENGVLYVLCGQGADGDYDGGDAWALAKYRSEDRGKSFQFDEMVPGTGKS